jgi:DNA-binding MarR family transcriptional regulator
VIRPAHTAVFGYLDDTGTTVSLLAERAQMTKQAMAELVIYLETHGYLTRTPDPTDRRAKLVRPAARGREVLAIAQSLVPDIEQRVTWALSPDRVSALRPGRRVLSQNGDMITASDSAGAGLRRPARRSRWSRSRCRRGKR